MSKNLVIVESPAKAKTIEKFLGKDFHVLSSQGHIRDIEPMGKNSLGIDFEHQYAPNYVVDVKKKALLDNLMSEVKKTQTVWLASDEDREGEAIAWHLKEVLQLKDKDTRRIVFHEITKEAILQAIEQPRDINYDLVNAQQARRVLDRIVGFELSPVLWKKVTTGLSAGRVQSVAVRLIVEREREIEEFQPSSQYRVLADFTGANPSDASVLHTELNHRFAEGQQAREFLESCIKSQYKVGDIQRRPVKRSPAPPFTTSSLQQEAARKLKFPVSKTMRLAQSLYEAGHITYMRTDSVNLSSLAINTAREEITVQYGSKYSHPRQFQTTTKGAQEAHEAIRPTYISKHAAGANSDEQRLYELIWKRTIASQMADAELETTRMEVSATGTDYLFVATGETIVFDGFMRAYVQSTDEQEEQTRILPQMAVNEALRLLEMNAQQTYSKPPFRYTEASLVKKMEELEVGRPSTYATIIETIQTRKYVERGNIVGNKRVVNQISLKSGKITERQKQEVYGADSQKLLPTDLGRITNDFLVDQFPNILSYDFTATEEQNFDLIAEGKADWVKTVDQFYRTFHPMLTNIPSGKMAGRDLGTDENGATYIAKITKIGPSVQMNLPQEDKPRFASLKKGQSLFTITLDDAKELFRMALPYTLCQLDGQDVIIGEGRFGPYIHYGKDYVSIPRTMDPLQITEQEALDLIRQKAQQQLPICDFGSIQVLNGRYGAYIKTAEGNYRIPKGVEASSLTEEKCREIIASSSPAAKQSGKHSSRGKSAK